MTMFESCKKVFMPVGLALALGACGGGEGGPSTGDTNDVGGGGGGDTTTMVSGTFVDSPVDGLDYLGLPSGTTGVTGDTGAAGGFEVEEGDTVTFSIGGLTLGTSGVVESNGIVTPAELAGDRTDANNARAIRIAQFLQSLDEDGDTSNGISISANTRSALANMGTGDRDGLQASISSGTDFETLFGSLVDDLTAGNAVERAEGNIVDALTAAEELLAAVEQATSGGGADSDSVIVAAATGNCPVGTLASAKETIFGQDFPVCVLSERITSNVTLTNDHVYVLQTAINVGDGEADTGPTGSNNAVLTVEPGTQIFGYDGLQSGLIITRGSRIEAVGTLDLPIIMAAVEAIGSGAAVVITDDPTDLSKRGQWAGLVLSGRGIDNRCVDGSLLSTEAAPEGQPRFFGCNNNSDNSGTVEYVIIAESGLGFRPDQEVQGLTVEAVGSASRINYLQVLGSEDDGIEWFGGAVNAANIVINGADDDALDMDEGYVGTVQNALIIMGAENGDKAIEADNAGPGVDAEPVSRPNFINVTLLGNQGSTNSSSGANWVVGFGGAMWRSAIVDHTNAPAGSGEFSRGCLDFTDQIDENVAFRDVAVRCDNGAKGTWGFGVVSTDGDTLEEDFAAGTGLDENGAALGDRSDFTLFAGTINPNTLALDPGVSPDNPVAPPAGVFGNAVGNYFGAVDPNSGNPDNNPNNNGNGGGPFWDGWTYRNSGVDGNLPGGNFHPLQAEIVSGQN
ncbi:MAG: hypothetical protein WD356_07105 [Pseudomonadales bacterium]